MPEISIVCGLGNPGLQYRGTRHNLGFMTVDLLAGRRSLKWKRGAGPAMETTWRVGPTSVILLKPLVFMNESGLALGRRLGVAAAELLVICDDMSLPLGQLRFRKSGGSGGHKGLESVIAVLGTEAFPRLRLGIGAPPPGTDWVDYVLSDFAPEERPDVDGMIENAAEAIESALRGGLESAMTRYNRPGPAAGSP
jgi:PTH1 family peptidyl-tRNA hydrolase